MHAERFDALVTFAGCDKSLPGMLMAAARVNLPSVFLYGGSILPGRVGDQALDVVSVFEAVGAHAVDALSDEELRLIEHNACPTEGSCAGMFTANTMASVAEALGMSLPGSSSPAGGRPPARRLRLRARAWPSSISCRANIRPRQIMTKEAFENAIAVVMALGGSTNAVLHLMAIANEARVDLELDDFNRIAARVPHITDTKPHGRYHMVDVDRVGGVPVVLPGAARGRPPARRLPHRDRQDDGREPGRARPARPRTATSSTRSTARSTRPAASPSSPVRSPRRVRW